MKKKMYLEECLQQCRKISPFVTSIDGILGVEAADNLKRIATRLTTKWHKLYYRTCRYVKSRIAITLVRATHRCIRGSRVRTHNISMQRPQWEYGAGINLFRYARQKNLKPRKLPPQNNPTDILGLMN